MHLYVITCEIVHNYTYMLNIIIIIIMGHLGTISWSLTPCDHTKYIALKCIELTVSIFNGNYHSVTLYHEWLKVWVRWRILTSHNCEHFISFKSVVVGDGHTEAKFTVSSTECIDRCWYCPCQKVNRIEILTTYVEEKCSSYS